MIDIHSHLIFNVDDGAESLEQSITIIKEALNSGVEKIIATPHYLEPSYISNKEDNLKYISEIQQELTKENIKKIEIYLGNEVYLDEKLVKKINERQNIDFK